MEPQTERLVRYLAHLTAKGIQALLGFNDSFGSLSESLNPGWASAIPS